MGSSSSSSWSSWLSSSSSPPTPGAALVERDLLSTMEVANYDNSKVNVMLTLRMPNDPALSIKTCTSCGETKTPLWRKGPHGPKTLCNACGIRYRKTVTKMRSSLTLATGPASPPNAGGRAAA